MLILCASSRVSCFSLLAAGCGQKGPLYLRESPPPGREAAEAQALRAGAVSARPARRREVGARAFLLSQRRAVRRRSRRWTKSRGRFGTPCFVYSAAAIEGAYGEFAQRAQRPRRAGLLFGQGEFEPRDPRAARAPRRGLRHRLRRRAGARARRRRRAAQDAVLRRRQERGRDPLRAGKGHRLHQCRIGSRARHGSNAIAQQLGKRAPVAFRVNPDIDAKTHPYISTGLRETKFGVAHGEAERLYARSAGHGGRGAGRHRLPHRLAAAGPRAVRRGRGAPDRAGRPAGARRAFGSSTSTSAAASASATRTRPPQPPAAFVAGVLAALGKRPHRRDPRPGPLAGR